MEFLKNMMYFAQASSVKLARRGLCNHNDLLVSAAAPAEEH